MMSGAELIYPEKESKVLEFKEKLPKFSSLIKTCVAFANTAGGQIIIGVQDETRLIVGVNEEDSKRVYEAFPGSLYDATNIGLFAHIYQHSYDGCAVLVIEVMQSSKRPCFVKKEGLPKGVYLRVGTSTRRAQEAHIEELMRESRHQYFDKDVTQAAYTDLSKSLLESCYGKSYSMKKLASDGIVAASSVSPETYQATVAGVLMFAENPERYVPESVILCTQFAGTSGREIIQTRELTGAIPQLIEISTSLVQHWLQRNFELEGVKLVGKMPIPLVALREAIINGLIHRKYNVPGALKIALYDDRLEIFSPGSLPGLVDVNHLGGGMTYLRNPHLVMLARRLHLVERLGTGIKMIFDACREVGLKKPAYYEGGDFVKVVFSFEPLVVPENSAEEVILQFINLRGSITVQDVVRLLGVSRNTATRKLGGLIEAGEIIRTGSGPSVKFYKAQPK